MKLFDLAVRSLEDSGYNKSPDFSSFMYYNDFPSCKFYHVGMKFCDESKCAIEFVAWKKNWITFWDHPDAGPKIVGPSPFHNWIEILKALHYEHRENITHVLACGPQNHLYNSHAQGLGEQFIVTSDGLSIPFNNGRMV